jgi:chromosome partitioning protein
MAVVITIAQQKGGAGKTTLAANLAAAFAAHCRVALLDIDPQRSLTRWGHLRAQGSAPAVLVSDVSGWRLARELERLQAASDVLVVDSPPQVDQDARRAIRAAGLVLIPVQPSAPDLWAAEGTLQIAAEEKRPTRLVLNRVAGGERAAQAARAMLGELPAMATALGNRAAYAQAFAKGLGITEAAPRSLAAGELRTLMDEVMLQAGIVLPAR